MQPFQKASGSRFNGTSGYGDPSGSMFNEACGSSDPCGSRYNGTSGYGDPSGSRYNGASGWVDPSGSRYNGASGYGDASGTRYNGASEWGDPSGSSYNGASGYGDASGSRSNVTSQDTRHKPTHIVEFSKDAMNIKDEEGNTWLHQVCEQGDELLLLKFLSADKNLDLNIMNKQEVTPLVYAIRNGKQKVIDILLECGASVQTRTSTGVTPLHEAASFGAFIAPLIQRGADIEAKTIEGQTPLHYAAQNQQGLAVQALLAFDANIDAIDENGAKPIHSAALIGNYKGGLLPLKVLIDARADLNEADNKGNYPLKIFLKELRTLVRNKRMMSEPQAKEILLLLLDGGAKVNAINAANVTALHEACDYENINLVQILLERGADPNVQSISHSTPLSCFMGNQLAGYPQPKQTFDMPKILKWTKLLINYGSEIGDKAFKYYKMLFNRCKISSAELKELKNIVEKKTSIKTHLKSLAGRWKNEYK